MAVKYPRIPRELHAGRKLSDEDREDIRKMYADGSSSYQQVADHFGVSKRMIIFIIKPETLAKSREHQKLRRQLGQEKSYGGPEAMRRYRARRRELGEKSKA